MVNVTGIGGNGETGARHLESVPGTGHFIRSKAGYLHTEEAALSDTVIGVDRPLLTRERVNNFIARIAPFPNGLIIGHSSEIGAIASFI